MGLLINSITETENTLSIKLNKQVNPAQLFEKYRLLRKNFFPEFIKVGSLQPLNCETIKLPFLIPFASENGLFIESDQNILWCQRVENILFEILKSSGNDTIDIDIIDTYSFGLNFENIIKLNKQSINIKIATDIYSAKSRISKLREIAFDFRNDISPIADFHTHIEVTNTVLKKLNVVVVNGLSTILNTLPSGSINELEALITKSSLLGFYFIIVKENLNTPKDEKIEFYKANLLNIRGVFQDQVYKTIWEPEFTINAYVSSINSKYIKQETEKPTSYLSGIEVKVGKSAGNDFNFRIGPNAGDGGAYHAIVGGQSGKGKSHFLKIFITNSSKKYSESELQFIIIDCKGMGFPEYKNNRPANVIDYESSANLDILINKLSDLDKEFEKRRSLFDKYGATDIENLFINKNIKIPRIVCIIDEFQVLYSENRKSKIVNAILVDKILLTGRAMGIHLIFATQALSVNVDRSIVQNIPIRIIFGVVEQQSILFLGNTAATNLPVGKAIFNYYNGRKEDNIAVTIEKN